GTGRRGTAHREGAAQCRLCGDRPRGRHRRAHPPGRPHPDRAAARGRAPGGAAGRPAPGRDRVPVRAGAHAHRCPARAAAPPWPAARAQRLRRPPPAGRTDDRPDRPDLPARRTLVRARLQVQPPDRLRPATDGRGHGTQRVPAAGADLHRRPAPLAALPPGRGLRLRARLRRRSLPVLPWPGRQRRPGGWRASGRAGLALRAATGGSGGCTVRRPCQRGGGGMSLLEDLRREGALRTLDHALALSLRRLDPGTPDAVAVAAALASLAVSAGHAGFRIDQPRALVDLSVDWPAPAQWQAGLEASRWVARPADPADEAQGSAPLVLEDGLLYLRRYREYERRLAAGLQRLGRGAVEPDGIDALAPLFARLFPQAAGGGDHQARAAAVALLHRLLLVTGGPGTGKTTTIARLLVLLGARAAAAGQPAPRIALAAPTGRAAERMAESLRRAAQQLSAEGIEDGLLAPLATTGRTLHRLLGTIPDSPRFRHHAGNPLAVDIVVVDEASMIDLPLMAKLVEAVPDGARLVLLGDPDQLPSVEAGDVLSGILAAAGDGMHLAASDARTLQPLLGEVEASAIEADTATPFPARHVHLVRGWRQSAALDLAPLAAAVRVGDQARALELLREGRLDGVHYHDAV